MDNKLLVFLALIALLPSALAFNAETHEFIAWKALEQLYPSCLEKINEGAVYPDRVLNDKTRHHCYEECPLEDKQSEYCPKIKDCPAFAEAQQWLGYADTNRDCNRAFNLAVASHYFADTKSVFHNLIGEDSACHSGFERKINDAVKAQKQEFSIEQCCKEPALCFSFNQNDLRDTIRFAAEKIGVVHREDIGTGAFGENSQLFMILLVFALATVVLLSKKKHRRR